MFSKQVLTKYVKSYPGRVNPSSTLIKDSGGSIGLDLETCGLVILFSGRKRQVTK